MFWASGADVWGRRPVYIACLAVYVASNIALSFNDSYAGLLALRMIQAIGSSATIAIGAGTVADITTPRERGSAMGLFSSGTMVATAIAPVLGGGLAQAWGWRGPFRFLAIYSGVVLHVIALFLPETLHSIVGNGSIPPRKIFNMNPFDYFRNGWHHTHPPVTPQEEQFVRDKVHEVPKPVACLKLLMQRDVLAILVYNSTHYTAFYMVTASASVIFAEKYRLNQIEIGLSFLPFGLGCVLSSIGSGLILDYEFRSVARAMGLTPLQAKSSDISRFPIERARLRAVAFIYIALACFFVGYGWAMTAILPLAVPLVFMFVIGILSTYGMTASTVILTDLFSDQAASANAANNLVRCLMGASGTAAVQYMVDAIGDGWTFTIVGGVCLAVQPLLWLELAYGRKWRAQRTFVCT